MKLIPPNGAQEGLFGSSVVLFSDSLLVGSMGDNYENKRHSGSVYVYSRVGWDGKWEAMQVLHPVRAQSFDQFGCSVGMSSSFLLVGSLNGKVSNVNSGKVYVFSKDTSDLNGKQWSQQGELTAPVLRGYDEFGKEISYSDDIAAISCAGDDSKGRDSGAVYIYRFNGGWSLQAKLVANDGREDQYFGGALSYSSGRLLVGSYDGVYNTSDTTDASSTRKFSNVRPTVYYFEGTGSLWSLQATLTHPDRVKGDQFGWSVAVKQDMAVVGAKYGDNEIGSVYVFTRLAGGHQLVTWTQTAKLVPSDTSRSRYFGDSIQLHGGVILVGAYGWSDQTHGGCAYVFARNQEGAQEASTWSQQAQIVATDTRSNSYFGRALSLSPDRDAVAVGAPGVEENGVEVGAVYIYRYSDGLLVDDLPHSRTTSSNSISAGGSNSFLTFLEISIVSALVLVLLSYCMCCTRSSNHKSNDKKIRRPPDVDSFSCIDDDSIGHQISQGDAAYSSERYELVSLGNSRPPEGIEEEGCSK